ncbi:MAG: hypothetical protein U0745_14955 [Polyangia bacterium]
MKTLLRALSLSFSVGALILLTGHAASDGAGCSSSSASKEPTKALPTSAPTQAAPAATPATPAAPAATPATPAAPAAPTPPASAPGGDAPSPNQLDPLNRPGPDRFMGASKSAAVFIRRPRPDAGVSVGASRPKAN